MPLKRAAATRKSAPPPSRLNDDDFEGDNMSRGGNGYDGLHEKQERLKDSMVQDASNRKSSRQRTLAQSFADKIRELQDKIKKTVDRDEQDKKSKQDEFVTRLLTLTQKKASTEHQLIQHTQELAKAYERVRKEFEVVLRGRTEDVRDALGALQELKPKDEDKPGVPA